MHRMVTALEVAGLAIGSMCLCVLVVAVISRLIAGLRWMFGI